MLLRFLLLLILLPPSVLSSESHFASLPPPTSLFSPSGQLYQSIYARKGLSTFGGSSSYVLKNSTLLIVNIRPIKKANVTSQISEYKTTITPVSSIKILPSPTPILLSSTSYLPSSLLSSLPTSLPSLLSYLTTSLNKLTLKPSHKTLGNYVNSEDYVVWNGEELYKIEGPEARAWKVNSAACGRLLDSELSEFNFELTENEILKKCVSLNKSKFKENEGWIEVCKCSVVEGRMKVEREFWDWNDDSGDKMFSGF